MNLGEASTYRPSIEFINFMFSGLNEHLSKNNSEEALNRKQGLFILASIAIVSLSFSFRLAYNANTELVEPIRADAANYVIYARNLIEHSTFSKQQSDNPIPDSFWSPGYPALLAAIIIASHYLEANSYEVLLFAQAFFGAMTVLLCLLLGRMFLPGYWSLIPATLTALSPHLVSIGSYAVTETVTCLLILGALYMSALTLAHKRPSLALISGVLLGLCYLANPVALLLAPLLCIVMIFLAKQNQARNKLTRLLVLTMIGPSAIFFLAWTARAQFMVPEDQPTASDRLIVNMIIGTYPDYHAKWRAKILEPNLTIEVPGDNVDKNLKSFINLTKERFFSNPDKYLQWYVIRKPFILWQWDIMVGYGDIYLYQINYSLYDTSKVALASYSLMKTLHTPLFYMALIGFGFAFASIKAEPVPILIYCTVFYISGVYIITQAEPRYSIPLRPELYLLATYTLVKITQVLARLRTKEQ
jgi:4-amino-4-deoxy-L-arabinose transferase-like glycosyltransferase